MDKKSLIGKLSGFKDALGKRMRVDVVLLFGSRAYGRPTKYSDVDLIVVSPAFRGVKFRKRPVELYDYWDIDLPVDLLCYSPEEFKSKSRDPTIVREALRRGISI